MLDSVRTRLMFWYTLLVAAVLAGFGVVVHEALSLRLRQRLDDELRTALRSVIGLMAREAAEGENLAQAARSALDELRFPDAAMEIHDVRGRLLARQLGVNGATPPPLSSLPPALATVTLRAVDLSAGSADVGGRVAFQRAGIPAAKSECIFVVYQSLKGVSDELAVLRGALFWVLPASLALAVAGGFCLMRRGLASAAALSDRARRLGAHDLGERLPVGNARDEFGRIALAFNELLDRLEEAFRQQRQFMADASHELRTPLSVIQTAAEVTLEREGRPESEYREALAATRRQARRLARIVADLLTLSRADDGGLAVGRAPLHLDDLLEETAEAARLLGRRKGVEVGWAAPLTGLELVGDEGLLRRMLLNLLDNAVKFTPPGGWVRLSAVSAGKNVEITVEDSGPGVAAADQPRIFQRFFQSDRSRTRGDEGPGSGAGLGLPIARWVAEAHGGRIDLRRSDERGSVFVVTLPVPS